MKGLHEMRDGLYDKLRNKEFIDDPKKGEDIRPTFLRPIKC